MRLFFGIILILLGAAAGLYCGLWLCFVGGIVDLIDAIRADVLEPKAVAIGVLEVMFSGVAGWLACVLVGLPGWLLLRRELESN